jgi:IMP dehydrogenase
MIIDKEGMMKNNINETITFDDVLLVPQYSEILSRKTIDLSSELDMKRKFDLPIVSSPMDTVTGATMASAMNKAGGFGVIHRYNSIEEQCDKIKRINGTPAAAIGVTGDYLERAMSLVKAGCDILCVDVAHGHHALMRHALKTLRNTIGYDIHIMAGNVATLKAFNDLADWGANSIRVGIGGGSICSTRIQTGHGVPTLQSVMDCSRSDRSAVLIADGGIKTPGDIVKSLAAGADFAMLGSMLAGTAESPGQVFHSKGKQYKSYRGMASVEAQIDWRGHTASVEGVSHTIPYKGSVVEILMSLEGSIRSGLSYTGALNLSDLRSKSQFIKQTAAGQTESSTHIKSRY